MTARTATYYIDKLQLQPHPEGGYFREIYRSEDMLPPGALPRQYDGARAVATSIYYLLKSGDISRLHMLDSDETWIIIDGAPLSMHLFTPLSQYFRINLGKDVHLNQYPQYTIPKQTHFSATPSLSDSYSLVACFVAPGFSFNDFHFSDKASLNKRFPQQQDIIEKFCAK